MSTIYQWQINKLECSSVEEKIVSKVYWSLTAKRGECECNSFGDVELNYEEGSEFIEYSELDEKIVLSWVKSELHGTVNDEKTLKEVLSTRLSELENEVALELPWGE